VGTPLRPSGGAPETGRILATDHRPCHRAEVRAESDTTTGRRPVAAGALARLPCRPQAAVGGEILVTGVRPATGVTEGAVGGDRTPAALLPGEEGTAVPRGGRALVEVHGRETVIGATSPAAVEGGAAAAAEPLAATRETLISEIVIEGAAKSHMHRPLLCSKRCSRKRVSAKRFSRSKLSRIGSILTIGRTIRQQLPQLQPPTTPAGTAAPSAAAIDNCNLAAKRCILPATNLIIAAACNNSCSILP